MGGKNDTPPWRFSCPCCLSTLLTETREAESRSHFSWLRGEIPLMDLKSSEYSTELLREKKGKEKSGGRREKWGWGTTDWSFSCSSGMEGREMTIHELVLLKSKLFCTGLYTDLHGYYCVRKRESCCRSSVREGFRKKPDILMHRQDNNHQVHTYW